MRLSWVVFAFIVPLCGCSSNSTTVSLGGSGSLAGTYTGFMQETGNGKVLDYNLAQVVTVTESTEILASELTFSSNAFPSFQAIVLSTSDTAVDLDLVGVNSAGNLQVQELGFTKDSNGHWILVLQTAGPPATGQMVGSLVQFASYDPMNAPPATAVDAVDYLDKMLSLVTGSQ